MFYDISEFPFLEKILKNADAIANEFGQKKDDPLLQNLMHDTTPIHNRHIEYWAKDGGFHVDQIGYDVGYGNAMPFVLFKKGFPIKQYDPHQMLPYTMEQILTVPGINFSAFFRLPPAGGTNEHVHIPKNLIFHLCLFDMVGESVMRCDGQEKIMKARGDYAIFDYTKPHSSFNYGQTSRLNLVIDFTPEPHIFKS